MAVRGLDPSARPLRFAVSALARLASLVAATVAIGSALLCRPAFALDVAFQPSPVLRKVLALYDSRAEPKPGETRIHRFAEMPINHLGFEVVYRDVNGALPEPAEMRGYRAVLTWLLEPLAEPERVGSWLERSLASQSLRYVVLADVLPSEDDRHEEIVARLYARLGLEYHSEHLELGFMSKPVHVDQRLIGFERPIDKVLPDFPILSAMRDRATAHLSLSLPFGKPGETSDVVVTSASGGYAAEPFTIYYEPGADRETWILNPFGFFKQALGPERMPVPDVTTVAGRRIYFSHIDGDGWNNQSEIERYKADGVLSSEVIWKEAIASYPDLPVSVALISCDIDPKYGADPAAARIARELFALPQVEVASHTHTHPFNWQFFASYDRDAEVARIDAYQRPLPSMRERLNEQVHLMAGKPVPVTRSSKYIAGSDDLPRTYLRNPFDLGTEISGSLKIAESLAPPGKRAKLYQWSGDTTPFEAALRETRRAGVRNINGGDSRLDREFPSVAYVPAISRMEGRERQIYAGNSNENTYTNDWTGPFYGFFMLEETLKNTETPRRLKPFNLYYHMYSGEKPAALSAIRHFLDMARRAPLAPIAASDYAAIADDFFGVGIEQVGPQAWAVFDRGSLETVRFDDADDLGLDMAHSAGVLGSNRLNGSLYVTLDRSVDRALVKLAARPLADSAVRDPAQRAALRDSRWRLRNAAGDACNFSFVAEGYGPGEMNFETVPGRRFEVDVRRGENTLRSAVATADSAGRLQLALAADAIQPVEVHFTCHD